MAKIESINVHGTSLKVNPGDHASSTSDYGLGDATNYGHVKLADGSTSTDDATSGTATTPKGSAAITNAILSNKGLGTITNGALLIGASNNTVSTRSVNNGTLVAGGTSIPTEGAVKTAISGLVKVSVNGTTLVFTAV